MRRFLDKETQLVWERVPASSGSELVWSNALAFCAQRIVGDRMGWRLPTVDELTSLLDLSVPLPGPVLPAGHPFSPAQVFYWSATVDQGDSGQA